MTTPTPRHFARVAQLACTVRPSAASQLDVTSASPVASRTVGTVECDDCSAGQFAASGQATCSFCTAGQSDDDSDPTTPCTACANGTYSALGDYILGSITLGERLRPAQSAVGPGLIFRASGVYDVR